MAAPTSPNVVHLNRYFHFTELMRDPEIECGVQRYRSDFDGSMQSLLVMKPAYGESQKLFFFFHGMDGDCGDGVVVRDLVKQENATVIAPGGRGPAWLADSFIADAIQTLRTFTQGTIGFYLIGVSMGGTQVLSLAGLLPEDLRELILGVVALIPGSNLQAMAEASTHERVRNTLGSSNADLHARSPINVLGGYKPALPFVVFYNEDDSLLRSDELETFVNALRSQGHPVATFSAPGNHNFTFLNFDYEELMRRMGSDSSVNGAPLRPGEQAS